MKDAQQLIDEMGLDKRKGILALSLILEGVIAGHIASLLGVKNITNSRSFGNKGNALSFSQKIDLLIDMEVLSAEMRAMFITFMEIRNQFAHNLEANSFENCFKYMEGKEKWILKLYPQSTSISKEEQLMNACMSLGYEVIKTTTDIAKKVKESKEKEAKADVMSRSHDAFMAMLPVLMQKIDELPKEQLINAGSLITHMVMDIWQEKFKL